MPRDLALRARQASGDQDGILARAQLRALGLDRFGVRTEIRAQRWIRASPTTVATSTGALSERQQWWVSVLETGCAEAALDGLTALRAAGLVGIDGPTTVSCPRGAKPRRPTGVIVHTTAWRYPGDSITAGIPRVRPGAAVIRGALWAPTDRIAALLVVASVQQRLVPARRLPPELVRIRRHRRRRFVARIVADVLDGARALGELDFARLCRTHRLPAPTRQAVRRGPDGRWYLDVYFDRYGVVVEIDGIQHVEGLAPVQDALRQNALAVQGDVVLRIPLLGLRLAPAQFIAQVEDALRARGWPGASA